MLFVEFVEVVGGWLWHNGRTDSMRKWSLTCLVNLWWKKQRIRWRVLLMMGVPLHGVVDFSGCRLLRGFHRVLIHFLL
jgi:hypothetical protein